MHAIKLKLKAFALHLGISFAIAAVVFLLVLGVWYPAPYYILSGGWQLLLLVLAIDVIIGPIITLLVYNQRKGKLERVGEFVVIGLLQLCALTYGVWSIFEARPVHMVFEYDRFRIIHANDILDETRRKLPEGIEVFPISGPTWLGLRPLEGREKFDFTLQALGGVAVAAQPQLWIPYEESHNEVLTSSKPVDDLIERFPASRKKIEAAIEKVGYPADRLRYLPIQGRKMETWTVLLDSNTAAPVIYLDIDPF